MHVEDLSRISDREFESLCCEVLGVKLACEVKQGRPGPDGGIDGFFPVAGNGKGVMQAKHYLRSGSNVLISRLRKVEVMKAKSSGASRYVLMTSCCLSPRERGDILKLFDGLIPFEEDIYSGEDICSMLDSPAYEWIKRRHFNLWLSDIDALERFCGDGACSRSESFLLDMREDLQRAVETWALAGSLGKLMHSNVLIITGQAGCGKTTLAKQLVANLVFTQGYVLVASDYDLDTFEKQLDLHPDRRTVFLLDDFLGANILSLITENRDAQIVRFIRRIKRSDSCKLIMTSRTYIISEALARYNKLADARMSDYVYELTDKKIARIDRAKIVHSHLYHGDVSQRYKDIVYGNENYFKIIDHKNFNPRIVAYSFDATKSSLREENETLVLSHILGMLDKPEQIWKDCFENLDELRLLIVMMVFLAASVKASVGGRQLEGVINRLLSSDRFSSMRVFSANGLLRDLCGSLLTRKVELKNLKQVVTYSLFNPSIGDYIIAAYGENTHLLADAVLALQDAEVAVGMHFQEVRHKSNERYVLSCRTAFGEVVDRLEKDVLHFLPDFVMGFVSKSVGFRSLSGDATNRIALACWQSGVYFSDIAEPIIVLDYLNWMLTHMRDKIALNALPKTFLDRLYLSAGDCEHLLILKSAYDHIAESTPDAFYDKFREYGNEWAYKIAADEVGCGDNTVDSITQYVAEFMTETFEDYDIDEDLISVAECMDGCDFSDYVRSRDDDGSDWEDVRESREFEKHFEDEQIRAIFRRG